MDSTPKTSAAQLRAAAKWEKTQDRFALRFPAGDGQALRDAAERAGQSVNAYTLQAIRERIARDNSSNGNGNGST